MRRLTAPAGLIARAAHPVLWALAGVILLVGPLTAAGRIILAVTPLLLAYMIFAAREIAVVREALAWRPVQLLAAGSYSLYLWQKLFLARPDLYRSDIGALTPPPILLLPLVVVVSVLLVERPLIRWGHRLSARWRCPVVQLAA